MRENRVARITLEIGYYESYGLISSPEKLTYTSGDDVLADGGDFFRKWAHENLDRVIDTIIYKDRRKKGKELKNTKQAEIF